MNRSKHTLRGVNIGSWLVLEKWMNPSVFANTDAGDEWQLAHTTGGLNAIRRHHKQWIEEGDFRWMSENNIELVRIPVGHWIFGDEPPYVASIESLDWAFDMAVKYNLKVLIDLHAAVGAQNAADHSGSGAPGKGREWLKSRQHQAATVKVLERIAERYRDNPALWGLELLNEPTRGLLGIRLTWFYRRAYRRLREIVRPKTYILFSDAFSPLLLINALRPWPVPVAMDTHIYFCFGKKAKRLPYNKQVKRVKRWRWLLRWIYLFHPVVVGEWSGALHIGTTDEEQREIIELQQKLHDGALASIYWSYKTEGSGAFNYRKMVERGLID